MNAYEDIICVLNEYFDALYYCDTEKVRRVFHANAIYATADETHFLYRTLEEYTQLISEREPPSERKEVRRDAIDSIEFAGNNTALARVRCSIGPRDFVDFLTFVRDDGQWQIISKVFQIIKATR